MAYNPKLSEIVYYKKVNDNDNGSDLANKMYSCVCIITRIDFCDASQPMADRYYCIRPIDFVKFSKFILKNLGWRTLDRNQDFWVRGDRISKPIIYTVSECK